MDINRAVAQNIKKIRKKKKLTLDAAAAATGVSRSMLAQIEKGDVNPTISVLWKIANGYKASFTSLVERLPESASVLEATAIHPLVEDEGRFVNYPIFHFDDQRLFETYRIVIAPDGYIQSDPHLSGTEEYITVFEGCIDISVNDKVFHLNKGDSIKFKADMIHSYKNIGDCDVQLSMLIYYS